jgi:hypothetical protein
MADADVPRTTRSSRFRLGRIFILVFDGLKVDGPTVARREGLRLIPSPDCRTLALFSDSSGALTTKYPLPSFFQTIRVRKSRSVTSDEI